MEGYERVWVGQVGELVAVLEIAAVGAPFGSDYFFWLQGGEPLVEFGCHCALCFDVCAVYIYIYIYRKCRLEMNVNGMNDGLRMMLTFWKIRSRWPRNVWKSFSFLFDER